MVKIGIAFIIWLWCCAVIPTTIYTAIGSPELVHVRDDSRISMGFEQDSGEPAEKCFLTVGNRSSFRFKYIMEQYRPNFVHFHLWFNNKTVVHTTHEAILPFQWVWTYSSADGSFPYLQWPVDFPILSFGLLDVKTEPRGEKLWLKIQMKGNCSLTLGEPSTTLLLAYALRDMTETYLLQLDRKIYSFSYYCFLEEVPGVKETVAYQLAVYLGFPVEFAAYRCCRTDVPKYTQSKMFVDCLPRQVRKMFQTTIIPYILGLVAFVYFPVFLLGYSKKLVAAGFYQRINEPEPIEDDGDDHDWVFLTGKSPLTFTGMIAGLCGLASKHPTFVSRIRRLLFILLCPCAIFIELYVYHKFQPDITMALLDHDLPMGYLSMLGGYENSKNNFMLAFGGPFVILPYFFIGGCFFLIFPSNMNAVIHDGSGFSQTTSGLSPLFFNEEMIEKYSGIHIINMFGYGKATSIMKGRLCMLVNPKFWVATFNIQCQRFTAVYNRFNHAFESRVALVFLCVPVGMVSGVLFLVEICLCILYYGMPIVSFIIIATKGYIVALMGILVHDGNQDSLIRSAVWSHVSKIRLLRYVMTITVSCSFILFLISFSTIFVASFSFVAKLLVFSLLSVIVYPSYSFGYLFFGVALLYYVYKLLKNFGDGYTELLSDTVEISQHMEEDLTLRSQVLNGTILLSRVDGANITQLQIYDTIINLSTDQRQQIRNARPSQICKTRERNSTVGIPRDLFEILVRNYRPVHIQVAKSLVWLVVVMGMIDITISLIVTQQQAPSEGIYEIMHVLFIMIVGALPELLGVIINRTDHATKKEIQMKKVKGTVVEYWVNVNRQYLNSGNQC